MFDCAHPEVRYAGIAHAAGALRSGRLVVLPTDTLYAITALASDRDAVRDLLAAKQRSPRMPASLLVGSWSAIDEVAGDVPELARRLIRAFWPGALSLVLPAAPSLDCRLGDTHGTVMVRMPLHPLALELIHQVGPLAQSSANLSGSAPALSAAAARSQLGSAVSIYLEAGQCSDRPSTIVSVIGKRPTILREGTIGTKAVAEVVGTVSVDG
ncbi:L-threonylcarbamoyladenylate synthase [Nocardia nova]|uniref:L-threonylcarbamoyladenylate synthase n=1 Tax=Nocardia nova TaxID=37330 RepID=UPI003711F793